MSKLTESGKLSSMLSKLDDTLASGTKKPLVSKADSVSKNLNALRKPADPDEMFGDDFDLGN